MHCARISSLGITQNAVDAVDYHTKLSTLPLLLLRPWKDLSGLLALLRLLHQLYDVVVSTSNSFAQRRGPHPCTTHPTGDMGTASFIQQQLGNIEMPALSREKKKSAVHCESDLGSA